MENVPAAKILKSISLLSPSSTPSIPPAAAFPFPLPEETAAFSQPSRTTSMSVLIQPGSERMCLYAGGLSSVRT